MEFCPWTQREHKFLVKKKIAFQLQFKFMQIVVIIKKQPCCTLARNPEAKLLLELQKRVYNACSWFHKVEMQVNIRKTVEVNISNMCI